VGARPEAAEDQARGVLHAREQYQADEAGESLVAAKRAGVDGRRDVLGPDAGKTLVGMNPDLTMSGGRGWTKRSHWPGAEPLLVLGYQVH
jgi:hypothetical protein